jgi:hypothetical protein
VTAGAPSIVAATGFGRPSAPLAKRAFFFLSSPFNGKRGEREPNAGEYDRSPLRSRSTRPLLSIWLYIGTSIKVAYDMRRAFRETDPTSPPAIEYEPKPEPGKATGQCYDAGMERWAPCEEVYRADGKPKRTK